MPSFFALDASLVVSLVTALASPTFVFLGVVYMQRRQARTALETAEAAQDANLRAADAQQIAVASEAEATRVRVAQDVLVRTIETMRSDMDRQDIDHERQLTALRDDHERKIAALSAEVKLVRQQFEDCERVRLEQGRELVLLRKRDTDGTG